MWFFFMDSSSLMKFSILPFIFLNILISFLKIYLTFMSDNFSVWISWWSLSIVYFFFLVGFQWFGLAKYSFITYQTLCMKNCRDYLKLWSISSSRGYWLLILTVGVRPVTLNYPGTELTQSLFTVSLALLLRSISLWVSAEARTFTWASLPWQTLYCNSASPQPQPTETVFISAQFLASGCHVLLSFCCSCHSPPLTNWQSPQGEKQQQISGYTLYFPSLWWSWPLKSALPW